MSKQSNNPTNNLTIHPPIVNPPKKKDAGQPRAFYVKLVGEGVDDHGGPYRAVFETAVGEEPAGGCLFLMKFVEFGGNGYACLRACNFLQSACSDTKRTPSPPRNKTT